MTRGRWLRVEALPSNAGRWAIFTALACAVSACGNDDGGTESSGTGAQASADGGSGGTRNGSGGSGGDVGSGGTGGAVSGDGASINDLGASCDDGFPDGLTAVEFCGFAGCDLGALCSCEIPCTPGDARSCPDGTTCAAVDDGPGDVCVRASCSSSAECGSVACCGVCGSQPCSGQCWDVSNGGDCPDGQLEL